MPLFISKKKDEEQQQGQNTQLSGGQGGVISPGTQSGVVQGNKTPSPSSSGRYTNLQAYLKANQGGHNATKLSGKLDEKAQEARTNLDTAKSDFNKQVQGSGVSFNKALIDEAKSNATAVNADPNKKSQFVAQRDASYSGPQSFQQFDPGREATTQAGRVADYGTALKSEEGRFSTLKELFKRPQYTRGQQSLDQMLIQNDPTARETLQGTQQRLGDLGSYATQVQQQGDEAARKRAQESKQARDYVREAFLGETGALPTFQSNLEQRVQDLTGQKNQLYQGLLEAIKAGDITPEQAAATGLEEGMRTWGVDPSQYLTAAQDPTVHSVASAEDFATYRALNELMGLDGNFLHDESLVGSYDPSKAISFDRAGFDRAVGDREKAYQSTLDNTLVSVTPAGISQSPYQVKLMDRIGELEPLYRSGEEMVQQYGGHNPFKNRYQELQKMLAGIREDFNYGKILK